MIKHTKSANNMKYYILILVLYITFLYQYGSCEKLHSQEPTADKNIYNLHKAVYLLKNKRPAGTNSVTVIQELYNKRCLCKTGFGLKDGMCVACDCGSDEDCLFVSPALGKKICLCKTGYGDKNGKCVDCECGPDANCTFRSSIFSRKDKECHCKAGYHEKNGKCIANGCSSNPCKNGGTCIDLDGFDFTCECKKPYSGETCETFCVCRGGDCVLQGKERVCKCPPGFGNFTNFSCKACDCGPDTSCIWESGFAGKKICLCKPGFSTKKGKCVACDCGDDISCEWISDGWLKPERKVCHCKPGYHEEDGKCVDKEELKKLQMFV